MKKFNKLTSVIISATIMVLTCYCQAFAQSEVETISIPNKEYKQSFSNCLC